MQLDAVRNFDPLHTRLYNIWLRKNVTRAQNIFSTSARPAGAKPKILDSHIISTHTKVVPGK